MIAEVAGLRVLAGYRGAPAGDVDALADTVVAMSRLSVEQPSVSEAEANPVRVHASGVVALDALVRWADWASCSR
jgi:acetate---CoA ligase (ADP-forming)